MNTFGLRSIFIRWRSRSRDASPLVRGSSIHHMQLLKLSESRVRISHCCVEKMDSV